MKRPAPNKVLITGGAPAGGLSSFAHTLSLGFASLGIPAEVIAPGAILQRWRELRDPNVLKILSTTAVFAAPLARRAICVAHGFPRADVHGWIKFMAIVASYKLANRCAQLACVSHYAAVHLRAIFSLRVDAVIHNPVNPLFNAPADDDAAERTYVTYVGRLHPVKRLEHIFPAICALLEEDPSLRACIIGDGELRESLAARARGNPRVEMKGALGAEDVCQWLRKTRVFVSGCETEALGIAYLEALSQGCTVVMPACGGGLEIAPELLGKSVRLLPLPLEQGTILSALREALHEDFTPFSASRCEASAIARRYLEADKSRIEPAAFTTRDAVIEG